MMNVIFFDLDETLLAQERAFTGAYQAIADAVAETHSIARDSFAAAIPQVAASCFDKLHIAGFVRGCGFGGRDILWGDPSGDSKELRELTAVAPVYREDVWSTLLERFSVNDPTLPERLDARFHHEMTTRMAAFEEVGQVLTSLRSRCRLAVITNGMPAAQKEKIRKAGLAEHFELIVASGEVGIGKPAAEIFQHALSAMAVEPGNTLMVGDSREGDVGGAMKMGMQACWIRRETPASEHPGEAVPTIPDLTGLEALLESLAAGTPAAAVR